MIKLSVTKYENTRVYILHPNNSISHNLLWNCVTLSSIFLDDLENHSELSKVVWQSVPNCQLPKLSKVTVAKFKNIYLKIANYFI